MLESRDDVQNDDLALVLRKLREHGLRHDPVFAVPERVAGIGLIRGVLERDAGALPLAQAGERGVFCDAQDPCQRVFAAGAVGGRALPHLQERLLHHVLGGKAVAQDGQGKAVDGIFRLRIQLGKRGFVSGGDARKQLLADRRIGGIAHSGDLFFRKVGLSVTSITHPHTILQIRRQNIARNCGEWKF